MPENITKYKIFLASPSDVAAERSAVDEVVAELNITHGAKKGYILDLLKWETHSIPGIGINDVQELINEDVGQDYDMFIGLLWTRFGTKTTNAESGTSEEFDLAYERYKLNPNRVKVLFYFKNAAINPSEIDVQQITNVLNYKKELQERKVLCGEFDDVEIFKKYLRMHIPHRIEELHNSGGSHKHEVKLDFPVDKEELGLIDHIENYTNFLESAFFSLGNINENLTWITEQITASTDELTRFQKQPNPNPNVIRASLHRLASSMDNFTSRLSSEKTMFYSNYEKAIDSGIGLSSVASDFTEQSNLEELENSKKSIFDMRIALIDAISGTGVLYDSITTLPRIEKKINESSKKMATELSDFIITLKEVLRLTEEFYRHIEERIDEMKLKLR